jgi:hypothetical protein
MNQVPITQPIGLGGHSDEVEEIPDPNDKFNACFRFGPGLSDWTSARYTTAL